MADIRSDGPASQRIDKWLWCARFYKTRTLAAKTVTTGSLRVSRNGTTQRISKTSFNIQPEDIITFNKDDRVRIIHILKCALKRGPASEAQTLYEDQSPPPPAKTERPADPFGREAGAGRPTKKERRVMDSSRKGDFD